MSLNHQCHGINRDGSRCSRKCDDRRFCNLHPSEGGKVTKFGFSVIQGVTPSAVSRWIKQGKIEADEDGYIEWEAADLALAMSRDPSRATQRTGTPHESSHFSDENYDVTPEEVARRYQAARMRKMEEDAQLSEIKRREAEGDLIARDKVQADARTIGVRVRAKMMAIPARVTGELVAMTDPKEIGQYLQDEIREALRALAMGDEDGE